MDLTIASWNIEINGTSSDQEKNRKVVDFIDHCCNQYNISIIFLCEINSNQIKQYIDYFTDKHNSNYLIDSLDSGFSNSYMILSRKDIGIAISYARLYGLNRGAIFIKWKELSLIMAHFKFAENDLTKVQLIKSAEFLTQIKKDGKWAITGDMNWDYEKVKELGFPSKHSNAYTCWAYERSSNEKIIDWCLASTNTEVKPMDLNAMFGSTNYFENNELDKKPVIFSMH